MLGTLTSPLLHTGKFSTVHRTLRFGFCRYPTVCCIPCKVENIFSFGLSAVGAVLLGTLVERFARFSSSFRQVRGDLWLLLVILRCILR